MTSLVCVESQRAKGQDSGLGTHHLRDPVSKGSKISDGISKGHIVRGYTVPLPINLHLLTLLTVFLYTEAGVLKKLSLAGLASRLLYS